MAFIYDELPKDIDASKVGYFETLLKDFQEIEPNLNFVYNLSGTKSISKDTVVIYYTGAFTYFHKGHYNLIEKSYNDLKNNHEDVRVIIAPANSSYIHEKYGPEYNVGNKIRFKRIISFIKESNCSFEEDIIIDMNPMLNTICDFNFTDLVKNYIEKYIPYETLINVPYILCGKDKDYFKNLESHTNKLKIYYDKGCDTSSSANLSAIGSFEKKHIILRVHTKKEAEVFRKYLGSYYASIHPFLISDEVIYVTDLINNNIDSGKYNNIYTNCKNYRGLIDYVRITRIFAHPLDDNPTIESPKIVEGDLYIDSDSFTGTTKNHIESFGSTLTCLYDFRLKQDTHDIVDIDDLYKSNFSYPHYDLSERMGLPLFDTNMHKVIQDLKDALNFL